MKNCGSAPQPADSLEVGQFIPGDMNVENIVDQPPQPARRQLGQLIWKGPTHLESASKTQTEKLTINIVGWHFSQLVWNRPSSLLGTGHLEKSKRED